ncbi:FAD-dependent oxidoreductase [Arcanobacterium haemolyticum]|uniref:FAD-dependent oxidoreductase n=1 Tax=Arcanobacterium haemolyticum TaxID=28264 RepID=UPI000D97B6BC|nr:FAD-dependent oxidoreductase [Arcanobacterium haemolyticum]SPT75058.1 Electron transfer flavoprotein-ubiquinone oxidoreductase [Arcanobacterium haemolyticum]
MGIDYDFDVIVVGAGVAGSTAAFLLAQRGHEVLLAERGGEPGEKNLSGGVFYSRVMDEIFEGFSVSAPVERRISRNILTLLNADSAVSLDYWDSRLADSGNAFSVLRARLDPWLAEQAEEAGVTLMSGVKVDELVVNDSGAVCGIRAGEDVLHAKVVVLADGINSFLARGAGLRSAPAPVTLGVGVKSVVRIGTDAVSQRFGVSDDDGAAYAIVGDATKGVPGGAFLYTNKDSVSLGIVVNVEDLAKSEHSAVELHDHLVNHPFVQPLLAGGELLEYGTHLVAEGGQKMVGQIAFDGAVIVGDAAGFTINNGFAIRGMDLAAESARCAALAVHDALEAEDYSVNALKAYERNVADSWLGKDMETFKKAPDFLATTPQMYGQIGEYAADVLHGVYNMDRTPRRRIVSLALAMLKKSPLSAWQLLKIVRKAKGAL